MGRRKKGRAINGWINLDKPADITSTQAVGRIRYLLNAQKAGHAGTLDPLATGILPIALGEATKTIPYIQNALKTYSFKVLWGEERDTDDAEGEVTTTSPHRPTEQDIQSILGQFTGDIEQTPPRYSAIKIKGQRAYDLAREGKEPEMKSRPAYIQSLELTEAHDDYASFHCVCGKGTYMRSLARDIARTLGTAGYIFDLRREAVGPFTQETAISLASFEELDHSPAPEDIDSNVLLPVQTALDDIPALAINEREAARLKNGQTLSFIARPDVERLHQAGIKAVADPVEVLTICYDVPVAIVEVRGIEIKPVRVLNL